MFKKGVDLERALSICGFKGICDQLQKNQTAVFAFNYR